MNRRENPLAKQKIPISNVVDFYDKISVREGNSKDSWFTFRDQLNEILLFTKKRIKILSHWINGSVLADGKNDASRLWQAKWSLIREDEKKHKLNEQ